MVNTPYTLTIILITAPLRKTCKLSMVGGILTAVNGLPSFAFNLLKLTFHVLGIQIIKLIRIGTILFALAKTRIRQVPINK